MTASGGTGRAACVIGWPAAHSRSPLIHRYWLKLHGIVGDYRAEAIPPERFAAFVQNLAAHGYVGANVTVPHKTAALALSQPDARAQAIGAANTLWLDHGILRATNTDAEGFIGNLDAAAPGWDAGIDTVLVLGAGGSARAVVFGLIDRGVPRVLIANRTLGRGEALAADFSPAAQAIAWEAVGEHLGATRLLVNTTTLGMAGQPPLVIALDRLPDDAVVADLVYVPLETGLLTAARGRGLRCADGLGMLLHQAVRGFALWFGVTPQVTAALRALVEADLKQTAPS